MSKNIITITDAAAGYLGRMLANEPGKVLKVGVDSKGCAGHKYSYTLVDPGQLDPRDEIIERDWGTIAIEVSSTFYLVGSTLDLVEDQFQSQLTWNNPWAVSTCGCGESFSLKEDDCKHDHGSNPEAVL